MEREILFRGKTYTDKWVYGYLLKGSIGNDFYILENVGVLPFWINPETVGQFTGLTDMNGRKVFEGDYLVVNYQGNFLNEGFVEYNNKNYCWCIKQKNGLLIHLDQYGSHFIQVIGNKWDNENF